MKMYHKCECADMLAFHPTVLEQFTCALCWGFWGRKRVPATLVVTWPILMTHQKT